MRVDDPGGELLTDRERQLSELVVQGKSNKQIAGILGISEATVKVHRGRVMQVPLAEIHSDRRGSSWRAASRFLY